MSAALKIDREEDARALFACNVLGLLDLDAEDFVKRFEGASPRLVERIREHHQRIQARMNQRVALEKETDNG